MRELALAQLHNACLHNRPIGIGTKHDGHAGFRHLGFLEVFSRRLLALSLGHCGSRYDIRTRGEQRLTVVGLASGYP